MTKRSELLEKESVADAIFVVAMQKIGWVADDGGITIKDGKTDIEIGWEDFGSLSISPLEYDGYTYNQINIWGDGTLEIQDADGESINWCNFDKSFLDEVLTKCTKD